LFPEPQSNPDRFDSIPYTVPNGFWIEVPFPATSTPVQGVTVPGMEVSVPIDVPLLGDERHKNWAKIVYSVDESKDSGWAFEGQFIAVGGIQDVPAGSVMIVYGEKGSRANPRIAAQVFTVNADATLTPQASARGRAWARTLRDPVLELLSDGAGRPPDQQEWGPELMLFTDQALREELRRRGDGTDSG
jgi:hypothetical protein